MQVKYAPHISCEWSDRECCPFFQRMFSITTVIKLAWLGLLQRDGHVFQNSVSPFFVFENQSTIIISRPSFGLSFCNKNARKASSLCNLKLHCVGQIMLDCQILSLEVSSFSFVVVFEFFWRFNFT